jgi:hypothetical protein
MTATIYLAIYQDNEKSITIEYVPLGEGCIEIISVDVQPRHRSRFEQRQKGKVYRRGLVLDEQEEDEESLLPVTRLEQLRLF